MNSNLKRFCLLLWITLISFPAWADESGNPAATPRPHDSRYPRNLWYRDHKRHSDRAQKGNLDLIFLGDSITFMWHPNGQVPWKEFYASRQAAFFGIPGDRTENLLWRVERCNLDVARPKVIVLQIGSNNFVKNHTAQQIAEGISAIVQTVRQKTPDTHVLLTGILPRYKIPLPQQNKINAANDIIKHLDDGKLVHVRILNDKFLDENGKVRRNLIYDGVHLTSEGYKIWAESIEADVSKLLGDQPKINPQQPAPEVN